jgi:hypothetical protein
MALTQIEIIRMLVGDTVSSPFYPVLSDEQYQALIDLYGPSTQNVAKWAAASIALTIAGYNIRERVGDEEIWNNYASNYLKALQAIIDNPIISIPNGMMPWAGGISWADVCANNSNPDNVRSPLTQIKTCDCDNKCGCGCGDTFGIEFIVI